MKTLLQNGKIYLERDCFAQSLYIEDGIIKQIGTDAELSHRITDDVEVIDCQGRTVIPGLNDSHMHFMQLSEVLHQVDIDGVPSIAEMVARCKAFMVEHPENAANGIHAIGWNQDLFEDGDRLPNRFDLDQVSTQIPIVLERVCGHIVSANTKAIEILGIDGNSPQYPDGSFLIGEDGYPNGIFTGNACNMIKTVVPDFTLEERKEFVMESMDYAVAHGLTSVQSNDIGTTFMDGPAAFAMFHDIYNQGLAKVRYRHQVCFNNLEEFKGYLTQGEFATNKADKADWLQLGPLKLFKDGSLGARTALSREPYADDATNHGLEWIKPEEMHAYCQLAKEHGLQVVTHVIGDAAIEKTMDCYEAAFIEGENKLRHALIHCQITDEALLQRIADSKILTMVQPIFLDYDMHIVEQRCGKALASTSYAFGTMAKKGIAMSFGTDCPVETYNPFPNIYSAVTRLDKKGNPAGGFYPEECVDVSTAIDAYTIGSAYAEFMEDYKGRLKEGYYADLVILDQDIFTINPVEIKNILPTLTMVGGTVMYQRDL